MLNQNIPLHTFTNSRSLLNLITKYFYTEKKRLKIDIKRIRNAYHAEDISNNGLLKSAHNLAEALSKVMHCYAFNKIMKNIFSNFWTEQCIYRTDSTCR